MLMRRIICCDPQERRRFPEHRTDKRLGWIPVVPGRKGWHFSWQRERTMFRAAFQSPWRIQRLSGGIRQTVLCHEKKQQPLWKARFNRPRSHPGWLVHPWRAGYLRHPKRNFFVTEAESLPICWRIASALHLWLRQLRQIESGDAESRARCALSNGGAEPVCFFARRNSGSFFDSSLSGTPTEVAKVLPRLIRSLDFRADSQA